MVYLWLSKGVRGYRHRPQAISREVKMSKLIPTGIPHSYEQGYLTHKNRGTLRIKKSKYEGSADYRHRPQAISREVKMSRISYDCCVTNRSCLRVKG